MRRSSVITTVLTAAALTLGTPALVRAQTAALTGNFDEIQIIVPPPERGTEAVCQTFLSPAIEGIIKRPVYRGAKWGILVQSLETGQTIYHYNANNYFIPASNAKLVTTAAALHKLNPNAPISSRTVREWVSTTNLRSNNYYADYLLRHIGGAGVAKQALSEMGVDPNQFRIADGSGLSRQNLATPNGIVTILRAMQAEPNREVFLASLPIAGVSGTLRNRMKTTPAQGAVSAKTGTLRGVRALSGYLEHPYYGTLVFSILANQPGTHGSALVAGIDQIILQINKVAPCES